MKLKINPPATDHGAFNTCLSTHLKREHRIDDIIETEREWKNRFNPNWQPAWFVVMNVVFSQCFLCLILSVDAGFAVYQGGKELSFSSFNAENGFSLLLEKKTELGTVQKLLEREWGSEKRKDCFFFFLFAKGTLVWLFFFGRADKVIFYILLQFLIVDLFKNNM